MIHALDLHGCPLIVAAQVRPISGMN
jgi:hypothetical protein